MPEPPDRQKRMLVKLAVARTDILIAQAACDLFLEHEPKPNTPFYAALNSAVVIAYCRPFTNNKPLGGLPAKYRRFANPRYNELHDDLLRQRREWIAHSEVTERKVVIVPQGSRFEPGGPPLPGSVGVETVAFAPDVIPEIRDLCADLYARLHADTERLLDAVYPPGFYAPSPIEIRLDDL